MSSSSSKCHFIKTYACGVWVQAPPDAVHNALTEIKQVAEEELNDAWGEETDKMPELPDADASDPDGPSLANLTKDSGSETALPTGSFPHTLTEALSSDRSFWAGLWQLAVFLRCGKDGMDSKFLKKAEVVRKRSKDLNWQQQLGFIKWVMRSCVPWILLYLFVWSSQRVLYSY